jgi:hypothetical protein
VAVRAFRDEPSLAAGRVSGHHQILVIHAPRARSRLNAGADQRQVGQRLGEVPLLEALPWHETAHAALLAGILDVLHGSSLTARDRSSSPPAEELSPTELGVLRYLPTNLSRPEIPPNYPSR